MSVPQIFCHTFFVTFYVPCLATFAALTQQLGWRAAASSTVLALAIVTVLTVGLRFATPLFVRACRRTCGRSRRLPVGGSGPILGGLRAVVAGSSVDFGSA